MQLWTSEGALGRMDAWVIPPLPGETLTRNVQIYGKGTKSSKKQA